MLDIPKVAERKPEPVSPPALRASFPFWLRSAFWVCMLIAVAIVLRRAAALLAPPGASTSPQMAGLNDWFASHALLTWAHILCALALVASLPFVLRAGSAKARGLQTAFLLLGTATGLTAYAMSSYAVGGWLERSSVLFYDTLYLVSLARAYVFMRQERRAEQRRWTIRAVAILLGIATTRPVMGVFFATAGVTHLTPSHFFGIAFWIGFSLNLVVIELWLRRSPGETVHV